VGLTTFSDLANSQLSEIKETIPTGQMIGLALMLSVLFGFSAQVEKALSGYPSANYTSGGSAPRPTRWGNFLTGLVSPQKSTTLYRTDNVCGAEFANSSNSQVKCDLVFVRKYIFHVSIKLSQLREEGLAGALFASTLAEAVFSGHILLSVNGSTPYSAVCGRVPLILPSVDQVDAPDEETDLRQVSSGARAQIT
jgi:hypothetical protein